MDSFGKGELFTVNIWYINKEYASLCIQRQNKANNEFEPECAPALANLEM